MKLKAESILIILLISLIPISPIEAQNNYVIDGDLVYVDDANIYLSAYPAYSSGGWLYINFTSKIYAGDIDLYFGVDTEFMKPKKAELYRPRYVNILHNETLPEGATYDIFIGNKTLKIYGTAEMNNPDFPEDWEGVLIKSVVYENVDANTLSYTYLTREFRVWKDISNRFENIYFNFAEMDKWYYHNGISINKGQAYYFRIWIDVSPQIDGSIKKYWIAVKPSGESLQYSIVNNRFYSLDPWYDSNWSYRKYHNVTGAAGAGVNYPVNITVNYGAGADSGKDVFCDSKCKTDFGDIRFTDDDGSTLLDYWIQYNFSSNYAFFWVKVADDLTNNQTIYMYYGNAGASTTSNGVNTFIDFWDFEDDTLETVPVDWTEDAANNSFKVRDYGSSQIAEANNTATSNFGVNYVNITDITTDNNRAIEFKYVPTDQTTYNYQIMRDQAAHANRGIFLSYRVANALYYYNGSWQDTGLDYHYNYSYIMKIYDIDLTNNNYNLDINGTNWINNGGFAAAITHIDFITLATGGSYTMRDLYDDVRVRKCVSPEPAHGGWGSEESPPSNFIYIIGVWFTGISSLKANSTVTLVNDTARQFNNNTEATFTPNLDDNYQFGRYQLENGSHIHFNTYVHNMTVNYTITAYALEAGGGGTAGVSMLLFAIVGGFAVMIAIVVLSKK